jgi:hypothetical protein
MTTIPDETLQQHAGRARGKVVLITGQCLLHACADAFGV